MQAHLLPSREVRHFVEYETDLSAALVLLSPLRHAQKGGGGLKPPHHEVDHGVTPATRLCPSTAATLRSRTPLVPKGKLERGHPTHATVTNLPTAFLSLILELTTKKEIIIH